MNLRGEARFVAALLAVAPLAVALLASVPAPAAAYCRLTTGMPRPGQTCSEKGEALRWERQCLSYSTVVRDTEQPPFVDVEQAIAESFQSWLEVECDGAPLPLEIAPTAEHATCDVPQHNHPQGNANAILFVNDWQERDYPPDAFGLTLVWHDPQTGTILDADMAINETMGELTLCPLDDCPADAVDVQNVVTHEAGHFLGLGHSFSRTSAMFFEARTGEVRKRFLSDDDSAGVCEIYGALEPAACTDADFTPRGGFRASCVLEDDGCRVGRTGESSKGGAGTLLMVLAALLAVRRRGSA
jgi:MYXO-CTERM domain-containing protein